MPFHKVKVGIILQLTLGNTSCKGNLKVNCKTLKDLLKYFYSGSCIQNGCSYDWCVGCGEQTSQCHSKGAYFSGPVESPGHFWWHRVVQQISVWQGGDHDDNRPSGCRTISPYPTKPCPSYILTSICSFKVLCQWLISISYRGYNLCKY